ncbi:ThiF family adenylyltransferase [Micromonospora avicenniae]|uniref:Molybdopterin or thiamine biosynthesis adenylyltransferase n=1 Tax=Micromonospora avicenniae TaxID=1198245 RepID=A0A1N7EQD7_9ACTN|nr:ThiF family adenylyltransferase [Micromonospora avicenniae]SIR90280.1 Molybdopterin or thiamine biosynthesis adenylyltransferase [Micromonospora avicenniae]
MARHPVNPPTDGWSLTLPPRLWAALADHLFRGDKEEHGAVILAGRADGPRGPRLLARELIIAKDGIDYVPGETGYRALAPSFVRDAAVRARNEGLAYLAVHNHFGDVRAGFSPIDLASHERGYPALRQITGQVVGGLVFTPQAAAGDLWLPDGSRVNLAETVIPGGNLIRLRPRPAREGAINLVHDRQARLFGQLGQESLSRMRVAVVGLGGVGSILVEGLARLGVGNLLLIDNDTVDETNLPRLLAAERDDIDKPKTVPAERNARRANPQIRLTVLEERVETSRARQALTSCDWIFLAADSHSARFWVNATVNQYLIPATQIGVKIPVDDQGNVGEIHAVNRFFVPGSGCMWCNGLIDPTELAIDMHPEHERAAARYVAGVPAPSVIALNGLVAMEAINHFMLATTGMHHDAGDTTSTIHLPRQRKRSAQLPRQDEHCPWCSPHGHLGQGET